MKVIYDKAYLRPSVDKNRITHKHFYQRKKDIEILVENRLYSHRSQDMLKICYRALNLISILTRRLFSFSVDKKKSPAFNRALIDLARQDLLRKSSHTLARSSFFTQGFCYAR